MSTDPPMSTSGPDHPSSSSHSTATPPNPSALLHLLTLKYLSDSGFASTSRAASLTLSSVLERYFLATAQHAADRAEHAGRRKVGALDVVEVLEETHGKGWVRDMESWVGEQKREEWTGEGWNRGLEAMSGEL